MFNKFFDTVIRFEKIWLFTLYVLEFIGYPFHYIFVELINSESSKKLFLMTLLLPLVFVFAPFAIISFLMLVVWDYSYMRRENTFSWWIYLIDEVVPYEI